MFDGMPEQFYQFLAATTVTTTTSSRTTAATADSLPLPLSFSLHHHNASSFPTYSPPPPSQEPTFDAPPYHHHLLHPSQFLPRNNIQVKQETLNLQHDALLLPEIPWSNDEMLALFRIRSTMDTSWFPDFIWDNVSRKLAELGFKRSAEKCKEKFEEEFNNSIISSNNCSNKNNASNNNYTLFGELEELCINNNTNTNHNINHGDHQQISHPLPPDHDHDQHHHHHHPQTSLSLKDDNEDEGENEDEDDGAEQVEENEDDAGDNGEEEEVNTRNDEDDNDNNNNNVEDEQTVDDDSEKTEETTKKVMRKRKRQKKFEMFKGFCKKIVNKMMDQQEQLHTKILQDMVKRDEEKVAREEAWKQQEIERVRKELEVRANEQAIVGDRQAKILDYLNKFSSSSSNILETHSFRETLENLSKVPNVTYTSILTHQDSISSHIPPTSSCTTHDHAHNSPLATHQTYPNKPTSLLNENVPLLSQIRLENSKISLPMSSSSMDQASQNPNPPSLNDSTRLPPKSSRSDPTSTNATDQSGPKAVVGKDETGRRWPRDEVLALINIRCSLFINNNINNGVDAHNDRESFSKGPLWERISQKMMELGYKRRAKRCKEKWENINKYFRKTKDLNKKRSLDSRTCPYFHQLSHLYSQGTLTGPTDLPINPPASPENSRTMAFSGGDQGGGSTPANCATNTMHASQGIEGVVQVPGFDFEF